MIPAARQLPASSDTVDIADVTRTVSRRWRVVIGFTVFGMALAAAVVIFAPRRFDGKATLLLRAGTAQGGSILGRMTGVGELLGSVAGLGGATGQVETELQVLRSRSLAGQVVDSLLLQVAVRDSDRRPSHSIVAAYDLPRSFPPRLVKLRREQSGSYDVEIGDTTYRWVPGQPGSLGIGTITLRDTLLPPAFSLLVFDHEDAISRFAKRFEASKAGGDVVKVTYRGDDSVTAAAVPNALISMYLERRRTTDRGVNQRRVEYVSAQLDQTGAELSAAERDLRLYQQSSGVLDAEAVGKAELEGASDMRRSFTELQVDEGGIKQLLAQAQSGRITSRDLAAYPSFIRGSAVSPLVTHLSELEGQRIRLLERRTERDPEVQALDSSMRAIEGNILAMATTYAEAVTRQRVEYQKRLDSLRNIVLALPVAAERGGRLKRDVVRLTQIYTALQAQLVEARLGAISEGGDVRQIDAAIPQRTPAFPQPVLTMGVGTAGGLVTGLIAALLMGWFGRSMRDPIDIERAVGVATLRLDPAAPLLLSGVGASRTLLVVPLDSRARATAVAESLAQAGSARSLQTTVVDLTHHDSDNGKGVTSGQNVSVFLDDLEQRNQLVVVTLPGLTSSATIAALRENRPVLLVAASGTDRARIGGAVDTLRRLQVPCAGIVVTDNVPALGARSRLWS